MFIKVIMVFIIMIGIVSLYLTIKDYNKNNANKYEKRLFYLDIINTVLYMIISVLIILERVPLEGSLFLIIILLQVLYNMIARRLKAKI